jgi:hypothetical protein
LVIENGVVALVICVFWVILTAFYAFRWVTVNGFFFFVALMKTCSDASCVGFHRGVAGLKLK